MSDAPDDDVNGLPDDFFNDLTDTKFIETVVEAPAAMVSEEDEQMKRCLAEIDQLQKDIARRKQKILKGEAGLSETESRKKGHRSRHSPSDSRKDRKRRRSRSRSSSPSFTSAGRSDKRRGHKDRRSRSPRSRSPRSRFKRSSSTHKSISFLEQLSKTFAERGQAFPEKDLLLNQNAMNAPETMMNQPNIPMAMDYGNPIPQYNPNIVPSQPVFQPPLVTYPIQQNMYYGMNPMAVMGQPLRANGPPGPTNLDQFPPMKPNPHPDDQTTQFMNANVQSNNQIALIDRCEHAIKMIRAKDNKVPVLRFLFNRTSTIVSNASDSNAKSVSKSPLHLHSTLNVPFKLNAEPNVQINKVPGIRMLPKRVKYICIALGINSSMMFDKLRTKELSNQISVQLKTELENVPQHSDILIQTKTIPDVEKFESSTQTEAIECKPCNERQKRIMVNKHTQIFPKVHSFGIQTNEKDYREPIVEQLSRMTAAQLVAVKDFADIITEPRPQNSVEIFKLRERLMDIYNLSQRDADTVRAEEERLAAEQRLAEEQHLMEATSYRSRSSNDMYREVSPAMHDFGSHSPGFLNGGNIGGNNINNPRFMVDNRGQRFSEERLLQERMAMEEQRMIDDRRMLEEQRMMDEQRERDRMIEIERQREHELEIEQRRILQSRREEMELRERQIEEQIHRQYSMQQQQNQQPMPFDDEIRGFNRMNDRDRNVFNAMPRGVAGMNRRGRGAFRDNAWGRGGRR